MSYNMQQTVAIHIYIQQIEKNKQLIEAFELINKRLTLESGLNEHDYGDIVDIIETALRSAHGGER